jgi:hypothetical protein
VHEYYNPHNFFFNVQGRSGIEQWHWCLLLLGSMIMDNDRDNGWDSPTMLGHSYQNTEGWGISRGQQKPLLCQDQLIKYSCSVATSVFDAWTEGDWRCILLQTMSCMSQVWLVATDLLLQIAVENSLLLHIPGIDDWVQFPVIDHCICICVDTYTHVRIWVSI